jgi:hypothetical protein
MSGKTFEILFTITGNYSVNDGTGQIIYAGYPSLYVQYSGQGSLFSVSTQGMATNATINPAKTMVTFYARFYSDISMHDPYVGSIIWTERTGPYSDNVYGYPKLSTCLNRRVCFTS